MCTCVYIYIYIYIFKPRLKFCSRSFSRVMKTKIISKGVGSKEMVVNIDYT